MDVLRLYAIYLLCSCYTWLLGSVYILQSDVLGVADDMSLREVRHDLGSHTDGPGIYTGRHHTRVIICLLADIYKPGRV